MAIFDDFSAWEVGTAAQDWPIIRPALQGICPATSAGLALDCLRFSPAPSLLTCETVLFISLGVLFTKCFLKSSAIQAPRVTIENTCRVEFVILPLRVGSDATWARVVLN